MGRDIFRNDWKIPYKTITLQRFGRHGPIAHDVDDPVFHLLKSRFLFELFYIK